MDVPSSLYELHTRLISGAFTTPGRQPWRSMLRDLGQVGATARPVVIQGGLASKSGHYEPLKRLLEARGFDVTVTRLRGHGWASIPNDALQLAAVVAEVSERSRTAGGDGLVTILAHSKGGLSARWYVQRMGGLDHVAQLITMATPHNGLRPLGKRLTPVALPFRGLPGLGDLTDAGRIVARLNRGFQEFMAAASRSHPSFRIVSIVGQVGVRGRRGTDGLIPVTAATLADEVPGTSTELFEGANHGSMAGYLGMHEPTMRRVVTLVGEGDAAPVVVLPADAGVGRRRPATIRRVDRSVAGRAPRASRP